MRLLIVFLTFFASTVHAAAEPIDRIVAVVNDGVVLQSELDRAIGVARQEIAGRGIATPPADALQEQVLERLITLRVQTQRAQEAGIRVDDRELNEVMGRIAAQNGVSLPAFADKLREEGMDYIAVREQIRDEVIISRLRSKEVESRVLVTDQDIATFLKDQARTADNEYRLSHILVSVAEGADAAARGVAKAKAELLLQRIKAGEDFAKLAIENSDGQQALEGGDLGWRKAEDLPDLFARALLRLKPGAISSVIEGGSGYQILWLREQRSLVARDTAEETRAQHILLMPNAIRDEEQTRLQMRDFHDRIKKGENFEALAKQFSDDPGSKAAGGDLGWAQPGLFSPDFQQVLDTLKPGEMSEPFRTSFGWHIARVAERRTRDITDDTRRARARQSIANRKTAEEYELWLRRLRAEAYVEMRLEAEVAAKPAVVPTPVPTPSPAIAPAAPVVSEPAPAPAAPLAPTPPPPPPP
ncbi:MAG: peptidylprolyl isomerase [Pseudomonadota bacterium]